MTYFKKVALTILTLVGASTSLTASAGGNAAYLWNTYQRLYGANDRNWEYCVTTQARTRTSFGQSYWVGKTWNGVNKSRYSPGPCTYYSHVAQVYINAYLKKNSVTLEEAIAETE